MRQHCAIYGPADGHNCSNGGLSKWNTHVVLVWDEEDPPEELQHRPVVKLCRDHGPDYLFATPVKEPEEGHTNYMWGGCFIFSSDSRFPSKAPIALHDRT